MPTTKSVPKKAPAKKLPATPAPAKKPAVKAFTKGKPTVPIIKKS